MSDRFDELVDHPSLTAEERARLRRVHDLLLDVGPPPEAAPYLRPPAAEAPVVPLRRRRGRAVALLAAALGAAVLGGAGYVLGSRDGTEEAAQTVTADRTVTATQATTVRETVTSSEQPSGPLVHMTGVGEAQGASATVELLPRAKSGDYPVRIRAEGLPERTTYEMWVVDDGELKDLCGSFTTGYDKTEATLSVPYEMKTRDEWVIVRPGTNEVVLTT